MGSAEQVKVHVLLAAVLLLAADVMTATAAGKYSMGKEALRVVLLLRSPTAYGLSLSANSQDSHLTV
jgi:hypothetical protein